MSRDLTGWPEILADEAVAKISAESRALERLAAELRRRSVATSADGSQRPGELDSLLSEEELLSIREQVQGMPVDLRPFSANAPSTRRSRLMWPLDALKLCVGGPPGCAFEVAKERGVPQVGCVSGSCSLHIQLGLQIGAEQEELWGAAVRAGVDSGLRAEHIAVPEGERIQTPGVDRDQLINKLQRSRRSAAAREVGQWLRAPGQTPPAVADDLACIVLRSPDSVVAWLGPVLDGSE